MVKWVMLDTHTLLGYITFIYDVAGIRINNKIKNYEYIRKI